MTGIYTNTTIRCPNCWYKQQGECKGNQNPGEVCGRFAFRKEYCSECHHYEDEYCRLYEEIVSGAEIACDDYELPDEVKKRAAEYVPHMKRSRK